LKSLVIKLFGKYQKLLLKQQKMKIKLYHLLILTNSRSNIYKGMQILLILDLANAKQLK
jgi:hypothetical protein